MSETLAVRMVTECCIECGLSFAMTIDFKLLKKGNGGTFYCPSGHSMFYKPGKSQAQIEADLLKKELAASIAAHDQTKADRDNERYLRMKAENKLYSHKRLIRTGTCPCCRRNFSNLQRHMSKQHPEYSKECAK